MRCPKRLINDDTQSNLLTQIQFRACFSSMLEAGSTLQESEHCLHVQTTNINAWQWQCDLMQPRVEEMNVFIISFIVVIILLSVATQNFLAPVNNTQASLCLLGLNFFSAAVAEKEFCNFSSVSSAVVHCNNCHAFLSSWMHKLIVKEEESSLTVSHFSSC